VTSGTQGSDVVHHNKAPSLSTPNNQLAIAERSLVQGQNKAQTHAGHYLPPNIPLQAKISF